MNPLKTETISIFNRVPSRKGIDTWYVTVIPNVHIERNREFLMRKYGKETSNKIWISMPLDGYKPPKEWAKSKKGFTLRETDDLVYLGEWTGEMKVQSDTFDQEALNESDYFYTVHVVSEFRMIPHLEISCG